MGVSIPSTSNRLERMDPTRDEATTVYSPFVRATMDRISSTTFPKVAFSKPPTVGPKRTARSSVISPRMSASGISPMMFCRKSMILSAVMCMCICKGLPNPESAEAGVCAISCHLQLFYTVRSSVIALRMSADRTSPTMLCRRRTGTFIHLFIIHSLDFRSWGQHFQL